MPTTQLHHVGDGAVLTIPAALLAQLQLSSDAHVDVVVHNGSLLVTPVTTVAQPRYTMTELLTASDYSHKQPPEEREWVDAPAVGRELI